MTDEELDQAMELYLRWVVYHHLGCGPVSLGTLEEIAEACGYPPDCPDSGRRVTASLLRLQSPNYADAVMRQWAGDR